MVRPQDLGPPELAACHAMRRAQPELGSPFLALNDYVIFFTVLAAGLRPVLAPVSPADGNPRGRCAHVHGHRALDTVYCLPVRDRPMTVAVHRELRFDRARTGQRPVQREHALGDRLAAGDAHARGALDIELRDSRDRIRELQR
jgi:hypothetical protein